MTMQIDMACPCSNLFLLCYAKHNKKIQFLILQKKNQKPKKFQKNDIDTMWVTVWVPQAVTVVTR